MIHLGKEFKARHLWQVGLCRTLFFWPFIVAGGRIVVRVILNLWNMVEPGGIS